MMTRLTLMQALTGGESMFQQMDTRYRQRRQHAAIPPDPTLAECFALLTKGDMTGIARTVGISSSAACGWSRCGSTCWRSTPTGIRGECDRRAERRRMRRLRDMLGHGGVMDWHAFSDAHGNDLGERPYLDFWAEKYETVMAGCGRGRCCSRERRTAADRGHPAGIAARSGRGVGHRVRAEERTNRGVRI